MIIKNLEDNKNEYIPFDIFIKLLERLLSTQDSEEDLINEFMKMDKVGDGTISESDLRNLMSNYENPLNSPIYLFSFIPIISFSLILYIYIPLPSFKSFFQSPIPNPQLNI